LFAGGGDGIDFGASFAVHHEEVGALRALPGAFSVLARDLFVGTGEAAATIDPPPAVEDGGEELLPRIEVDRLAGQPALDVDEVALDVANDVPGVIDAELQPALAAVQQVAIVALDGQSDIFADDDFAAQNRDAVGAVPLLPGFDRRYQPLCALGLSLA